MRQKRGNIISIYESRNWPAMEMASILQIAVEAGSETKRLVEPDPGMIRGPHRDLAVSGLRAIAAGQYGDDYHGVNTSQAANLLAHFEWPLKAEAS